MVFGKIKEFKPTFNEVKVMKNGVEKRDEAKNLNKRLNDLKRFTDENAGLKFITDTLFG